VHRPIIFQLRNKGNKLLARTSVDASRILRLIIGKYVGHVVRMGEERKM
jgi:hypothetical protein